MASGQPVDFERGVIKSVYTGSKEERGPILRLLVRGLTLPRFFDLFCRTNALYLRCRALPKGFFRVYQWGGATMNSAIWQGSFCRPRA